MLRLSGGQVESLFDLGLPVEVRELPADLAALDRLLNVSRPGFDGDLEARMMSWREEMLRRPWHDRRGIPRS